MEQNSQKCQNLVNCNHTRPNDVGGPPLFLTLWAKDGWCGTLPAHRTEALVHSWTGKFEVVCFPLVKWKFGPGAKVGTLRWNFGSWAKVWLRVWMGDDRDVWPLCSYIGKCSCLLVITVEPHDNWCTIPLTQEVLAVAVQFVLIMVNIGHMMWQPSWIWYLSHFHTSTSLLNVVRMYSDNLWTHHTSWFAELGSHLEYPEWLPEDVLFVGYLRSLTNLQEYARKWFDWPFVILYFAHFWISWPLLSKSLKNICTWCW